MDLIQALPAPESYRTTGDGHYKSAFAVSELANASIAAFGQQMAQLIQCQGLQPGAGSVTVDQRLASLWFGYSFAARGWDLPSLWDPIAGNYQCRDGWIRLHTNLPHHREAALAVLGCVGSPEAVRQAVATWDGNTLEQEIVSRGGVAALMRSRSDWLTHPQGKAVAAEPLIHWGDKRRIRLRPRPSASLARPLQGLRVLDLTRVLAGPIATRSLAGFGAEVLRIDPPGWDEPGVIQDISLGKKMAMLDLQSAAGRNQFESLLTHADVLVHGYRPDALDRLGYDLASRNRIAPNRIEVTLDAYGWTGPWAQRRGFDSLVQMSAGISDAGAQWASASTPTPLPVQALDHATGYLMAAAVVSALTAAMAQGHTCNARLSLARTAEELVCLPQILQGPEIAKAKDTDYDPESEISSWGPGLRLKPALHIGQIPMRWSTPARACGTAPAQWADI